MAESRVDVMLSNALVHLGTKVPGYGCVKAVRFVDGERFYCFAEGNAVSVIDAYTVHCALLNVKRRAARRAAKPRSDT